MKGQQQDPTATLSMLDPSGSRNRIIPAEVSGRFRRRRTITHAILLVIFLALPWININGTQAVLLDIGSRRFELFGQVFLSHDAPLVFFIFAIAVLLIMLATALWGRAWCGWACPQTVFIDAVFRRIEIWTEGDYKARRLLATAPMSWSKLRKLVVKWGLFFLVSSVIAHSFIAYFSGSERLIEMMKAPPGQNWGYFLMVAGVTLLVLFDFGWFREQFCIIMCPYGRFQSVLLDNSSLNVTYNEERGEPRKGSPLRSEKKGDCISCFRCVQVCPTGIDIRNGTSQLECISCTACIDACDEIMERVGKPKGLIAYTPPDPKTKPNYLRPRVLAYLALLLICIVGLTFNLSHRMPYSLTVLRAKDIPYQISPDGSVLNHFKAHIHNQSYQTQIFTVSTTSNVKLTQASPSYRVEAGQSREVHLFLNFDKKELKSDGTASFNLKIEESETQTKELIPLRVVGPYSGGSSSEVTNP